MMTLSASVSSCGRRQAIAVASAARFAVEGGVVLIDLDHPGLSDLGSYQRARLLDFEGDNHEANRNPNRGRDLHPYECPVFDQLCHGGFSARSSSAKPRLALPSRIIPRSRTTVARIG
tara:strand:- start:103 stop:456 length:354 start_codon:yes stop_codon:yes gene_type:complete